MPIGQILYLIAGGLMLLAGGLMAVRKAQAPDAETGTGISKRKRLRLPLSLMFLALGAMFVALSFNVGPQGE